MLESSSLHALASQIKKSSGILQFQMSSVIHNYNIVIRRLPFIHKIGNHLSVKTAAEYRINPEMGKGSIQVGESKGDPVIILAVSCASFIQRREIYKIGHPYISSLLTVLVEISKDILCYSVCTSLARVVFLYKNINSESRDTV